MATIDDIYNLLNSYLNSNSNSTSNNNSTYRRSYVGLSDEDRFKEQLKHEDILDLRNNDRYVDAMKAEEELFNLKLTNLRALRKQALDDGDKEEARRLINEEILLLREYRRDKKEKNIFTESEKEITKAVSKIKDFYSTVKSLDDPWAKADHAASKFTKTVGGTKAAMDALRSNTIDNVAKGIATNFNVSMEELVKAQTDYINGIGRNISIDNVAKESLAAIASFSESTGIDGLGLAAQFENFGIGIEKTGDHLGKMFSDASKSGINLNKYADNVAKNIKIAQNYTFKDGIKGLESMAKKATAIKLDMQQIANFADKVNTVEGAIEASAKIQVLGGPFAAMSDPMGMLNEALNDIEGLGDRQIKLLSQFGHLNKATGEVTVGSFDKQRIKAYAEATGQDYSALMEEVHTATKQREINKQIESSARASKFDDELKEYIKNTGVIKDGKVGINTADGFKTLDQLDPEKDKEYLKQMSQGQSEDIKQIAIDLRSIKDERSGVAKAYEAWQAKMLAFVGHIEKWALGFFDSGFGRTILGITASLGALKLIPATMKLFSGISGLIKAPFNFFKNLPIKDFFSGISGKIGGLFKGGLFKGLGGKLGGLFKGFKLPGIARSAGGAAGTVGRSALGFLSKLGPLLMKGGAALASPWGLAALGTAAAVGGIVYATKKAKARNKKALETQLAEKNIELKGDYGNNRLKKIDKALQTGEISDRLRRKLIAKGDIEIVKEIEKRKEELEIKNGKTPEEQIKEKFNINVAEINIASANFKDFGVKYPSISLSKNDKQGLNYSTFKNDNFSVNNIFNSSPLIKPSPKQNISLSEKVRERTDNFKKDIEDKIEVPKSFDININGSLKLTGDRGQSIDIIDELRKNPQMLRTLSDMIVKEIGYLDKGAYIIQKGNK